VGVQVTEMWDNWDLTHAMHRRTFDHPALYSFVDVSQNNHQQGQTHWDNMQAARRLVADPPRPMNNVKIYGGEHHGGGLMEGAHKLWRSVLGGAHTPAGIVSTAGRRFTFLITNSSSITSGSSVPEGRISICDWSRRVWYEHEDRLNAIQV